MADQVYGIDAASASLVPLAASAPSFLIYTFRSQNTNSTFWDMLPNSFGQELAVLYMRARSANANGPTQNTVPLDVQINSVSILSKGSPASLIIPTIGQNQFGFSQLWSANLSEVPLFGVSDMLQVVGPQNYYGGIVDVCMIPSSQLSLVGG